MSHRPTAEQAAIVDASTTGEHLVVEAGAGTGKTSTLKLLARANPRRRGVYMAYNKAIATEAARDFPRTVLCKTSHGLAFQAIGRRYAHRLKAPRMPAREIAKLLRINEPARVVDELGPLAPQQLARITMQTVEKFCYSADQQIERWHVPKLAGLDGVNARQALAQVILPHARRAWEDISRIDGVLPFKHDNYLKLWALGNPILPGDYVLLDEAQDSNAAVAGIVERQNAQRILVGDRSQAIYGWRGATDAMATFQGRRLQLSQSFRFGPAVAEEANKWLAILDAPLRLTGHQPIRSEVVSLALPDGPDAILCRTNAEAVKQASAALDAGVPVALVGGGDDVRRLAEAAIELQAGLGTAHPDLMAFSSWAEVQDYVAQDAAGADLAVAVKLIDDHTAEGVLRILGSLVDEHQAHLVLSTAHKAKGREWKHVRIADDFREPRISEDRPDPQVPREDAMLAYVAVTRARQVLDRSGLAWVDRWAPTDRIDRPSAAALLEDDAALERHLRQIAAREVPRPSIDRLIEASSLGTPDAVALREQARRDVAGELTGMPEEQADWDGDEAWPEPVPVDEPVNQPVDEPVTPDEEALRIAAVDAVWSR
ncbi:UvrD-helicase domain-containing protein [Dactylosporangium sp. NPDC000521]|uniref:UvrD-helicase domain-containing protein n=1 Tax=Dactylosporangium sp. NPDC000521 TaxID=3363975 RepID=UPI00369EC606